MYICVYVCIYGTRMEQEWHMNGTRITLFTQIIHPYLSQESPHELTSNMVIDPRTYPPSSWSSSVWEFLPIPSPQNAITSVTSSNPLQSCQHPGIQAPGLQTQASRIWNLKIRGIQSGATGWHKGFQRFSGSQRAADILVPELLKSSKINRNQWKSI